jgi:hypothetical protein
MGRANCNLRARKKKTDIHTPVLCTVLMKEAETCSHVQNKSKGDMLDGFCVCIHIHTPTIYIYVYIIIYIL